MKKPNALQIVILWLGITVICFLCFDPPTYHYRTKYYRCFRVDYARLLPACFAIITVVVGGLLSTMGLSNDKAKKRIKSALIMIGRTIIVIILLSGFSLFFYLACGAVASIDWHKLTQREHTSRFAESDTVGNVATPSVPKKSSFSHLDTQPITDKPEPVQLDPAAAHTFEDWDEDTEPVYIDPCVLKMFEDWQPSQKAN